MKEYECRALVSCGCSTERQQHALTISMERILGMPTVPIRGVFTCAKCHQPAVVYKLLVDFTAVQDAFGKRVSSLCFDYTDKDAQLFREVGILLEGKGK